MTALFFPPAVSRRPRIVRELADGFQDRRAKITSIRQSRLFEAKPEARSGQLCDLHTTGTNQWRKLFSPSPSRIDNGTYERQAMARLSSLATYYRLRALAELLRVFRRTKAERRSALIVPPDSPGSIGDDAMVCALVSALRRRGYARVDVGALQPAAPRRFNTVIDHQPDLAGVLSKRVTGGEIARFLRTSRSYDDLFIIGADILDGYYSEKVSTLRIALAQWAAKAGLRVTFTGFSFNEHPKPAAVAGLRNLAHTARLCARDPFSVQRVKDAIGHDPLAVADLAFLLEPTPPTDSALLHWLDTAEKGGGRILGLNAIHTAKFFSERREAAQDSYVAFHIELIKRLLAKHAESSLILIPHDYRPRGIGEGPLLEEIYKRLDEHIQRRVLLMRDEYSASEIKWICSRLDFVVSSRMHLAIAALGQGAPVFCFTYQGKFQGLLELFGKPELVASMDEILQDPEALFDRIERAYLDGASIRESLRARLPYIISLAHANIPQGS